MSWLYRRLVRPILFAQDSEQIHNRTMRGLNWASRHDAVCAAIRSLCEPSLLPTEVFGLNFPNPVGLAAGMDKHAEALPAWQALGFGFSELGGVTWHPQPGNESPRIFRAVADEALINRMGFNNPGAEAVAERLAQWRAAGRWPTHPVGINLGKSKIAPLDKAPEDYANSFRALRPHADFFVVNVSSPNTPNLRQLQDKRALDEILAAIQDVQSVVGRGSRGEGGLAESGALCSSPLDARPILVKVAPDLTFEALDELLELVGPRHIAGIVATNTTISRPESTDAALQRIYAEPGGLSGRPLRARSTEVIRHIYRQTQGSLPIIGVGGIFNAADAWDKIAAGASLVQIYTGFVYEGPGIVGRIISGLIERLEEAGLKEIGQAVGMKAAATSEN